ncbi:MAG: hypothetical protein M3178_13550 [Pseudomonadota bacterium]|nr:hypothetical protein [Pseudomonadota bacterium]
MQDAYVISGDTGEKIVMKVGTNTGWLCPADTTALPPNGILTLRAEFNAPYGIAAVDFFRDWKIMHLITKCDDVPHRIIVNEKMVSALYENFRPNPIGPRVTQLSGIMR